MTNGQLEPYTNKMKSGMNEIAAKNQHKAKSNRLSERERERERRREDERKSAREHVQTACGDYKNSLGESN